MPVSSFQRKDGFLLVRQYLYSWTLLFLALLSDSSTYTSRIAYAEIYHSMKYCKFSRAFKQSILEFTSRVNDRRYLASVCKDISPGQYYASSIYILQPSVQIRPMVYIFSSFNAEIPSTACKQSSNKQNNLRTSFCRRKHLLRSSVKIDQEREKDTERKRERESGCW